MGRMFSDLAELDFTPPAFEESRLLLDLDGYAGQRSIFTGTTNVQPLLRLVLSQELTRTGRPGGTHGPLPTPFWPGAAALVSGRPYGSRCASDHRI